MRVLDVSLDLGPNATPYQVESLVKAVRVATQLARDTESMRVRRAAMEQMKFPTDKELRDAIERLPEGGAETGPRYRARIHLETRDQLAEQAERFSPDFWYDYWYRRRRRSEELSSSTFSLSGYERAFAGFAVPWVGTNLGLDVLDPVLYRALVADQVSRLSPTEIVVREVRYSNPFGEVVTGTKTAEKAVETTARVIETAATLGSRRKLKKVEARIAEETADDRIDESRLDVELKREALRRTRLENDLAEEELLSRRIQNAQVLDALTLQRRQQALVDHFTAAGAIDEADAIAAADPFDVATLTEFALRPPGLYSSDEPDPEDSD